MANVHEPVCRLCRREGVKLFLKGDKCVGERCTFTKRNATPPGQHGLARRRRVSEYGVQLRAKQRARRIYGVLEAQFRIYFDAAAKSKGITGVLLLQTLERRLDNVVYRAGLASSRQEARQLVGHRHFHVNGRPVNIPSYQVRAGEVITVRERSRQMELFQRAAAGSRSVPAWLAVMPESLRIDVVRPPERQEMDTTIDEQLIVEYYSR
ncbi:MAG TPA: 30S ribosomal protein S4 [Candidatus Dormibacteraeota bacterium]|nr:30S ribosomal protein S4 [Candidatus Dormibacteraeota bacterium]